jgi:hypothetical protein
LPRQLGLLDQSLAALLVEKSLVEVARLSG